MARNSCIQFQSNSPVAVLRSEYLDICEGKHCPAMVLSQMQHWHEVKMQAREQAQRHNEINQRGGKPADQDTGLWVYKTGAEMQSELMGMFGEKAVGAAFAYLVERGFLKVRTNPHQPWDRTKQYLFQVAEVQNALRKNAESSPHWRGNESAEPEGSIPPVRALLPTEKTSKVPSQINNKDARVFDKKVVPERVTEREEAAANRVWKAPPGWKLGGGESKPSLPL